MIIIFFCALRKSQICVNYVVDLTGRCSQMTILSDARVFQQDITFRDN